MYIMDGHNHMGVVSISDYNLLDNNSLMSSLVHSSMGDLPSAGFFTLTSAPAPNTSSTFGKSFSLHAISKRISTGSNPDSINTSKES